MPQMLAHLHTRYIILRMVRRMMTDPTVANQTWDPKDKVDTLIWDDCCIMTSELCATLWIRKPAVMAIIRKLGYR